MKNFLSVFIAGIMLSSLVFIAPMPTAYGTLSISDDATGGSCTTVGVWDGSTKTCTLTSDVQGGIIIASSGITLDGNGFTMTGTPFSDGVLLQGVGGVTIKNLLVKDFGGSGIRLRTAGGNTITNNILSGNNQGIDLFFISSGNTVTGNTISGGNSGISTTHSSSFNIIANNIIDSHFTGFSISFRANNNVFADNKVTTTDFHGISGIESSGNTIRNNIISAGENGVDVALFNNNVIKDNTITGFRIGISTESSSGNMVAGNTISAEIDNAVYLRAGSNNNDFTNNVISSNNGYREDGSSGNLLSSNSISGKIVGIRADSITITENTISSDGTGIEVGGASIVTKNTVTSKNVAVVAKSSGSQIYNNNFISPNGGFSFGTNTFNLPKPSGGNYWSNYDSPEEGCNNLNGDRFCDSPYVFSNGQDDLPWTRQSGWELPNAAPICTSTTPNQDSIWPPNHKMVDISITGVTDPDGDSVTIEITKIEQDEPTNGLGDGDTSPDGIINGETAQVRAERSGTEDGRVYEISFMADDGKGGTCSGSVTIGVPHDKNSAAVDSGARFDSTKP